MPRHLAALGLAVAVLVGACSDGDGDRPTITEWSTIWEPTRDLLPTAGELDQGGEDLCGEVLGEVRARREELLPAPTDDLDPVVEEWVAGVEGFALDCPGPDEDLDARLGDLQQLTDRVNDLAGLR